MKFSFQQSHPVKTFFKRLILALLAVVLILGAIWGVRLLGFQNFGVVHQGEFYRSSQMNGEQLQETIAEYGIKTVLNLRGPNPNQAWYPEELAASQAAGAEHVDVLLSATHFPRPDEMLKLLGVLDHAPRPILVHCVSGADRTGLAVSLYRLTQRHEPLEQAKEGLTFWFGHLWFAQAWPMGRFLEMYDQAGRPPIVPWVDGPYRMWYAQALTQGEIDE
ncbi:MAG: hypothetical protein AUJ55_05565 [Proteobacteria bacterium CG1_02_64_396]|nr:MAG: hypothetical protein AUJ55_05565 [Proteobacteria bacterium CG1_02_64_396]